MIIYGFSGGSANPASKGSIWNRWGTGTPLLWCQQRMHCGVVHRLPWVLDSDHPRNFWRLCGSVSAAAHTSQGFPSQCPCTAWSGSLAFSCQPQALHTTVDGACHDRPSWQHFPPIAAWPWWVWPQSWYTLHGPGPQHLWYDLASRSQVWNGGHTCKRSPSVWHACSPVSKLRIHTGERSRLQLCRLSASSRGKCYGVCSLLSTWSALLILDLISFSGNPLFEMVLPGYLKLSTFASGVIDAVIWLYGVVFIAGWCSTSVLLRLMVRPKACDASENEFCWASSAGCCPCVSGGHSHSQIVLLESVGVATLSLHSDARDQRGRCPSSIWCRCCGSILSFVYILISSVSNSLSYITIPQNKGK